MGLEAGIEVCQEAEQPRHAVYMSVKRQHEEFDTVKHWEDTEEGSRGLVPLKSMLKTLDLILWTDIL